MRIESELNDKLMNVNYGEEIYLPYCYVDEKYGPRKVCLVVSLMVILILAGTFTSQAQVLPAYSNQEIVDAIYLAEGCPKCEYLWGIRSVSYENYEEAEEIVNRSIRRNRSRYSKYGHKVFRSFEQFLASRWSPVGVRNDPKNLNQNTQAHEPKQVFNQNITKPTYLPQTASSDLKGSYQDDN